MNHTDDLLIRLRSHAYSRERQEAADEIERLRTRNQEMESAFRDFVLAHDGLTVRNEGQPHKVLMADLDAAGRHYENAMERMKSPVDGGGS